MVSRIIINKKSVLILAISLIFSQQAFSQQPKAAPESEKAKTEVTTPKTEAEETAVTGWRVKDFRPYIKALSELQKLNKEFSENMLKLAMDEYATGLDILEDMENEVIKMKTANKNKKYLSERWYWQEIDRKNREVRQIHMKKREAKMKAITYFTRSIKHLDDVLSVEIRKDPKFINFQSRLYQVYVSTNYDLQNFKPCIPILERYISLSDKNKKDIWAYQYLASCYGYMEKVLEKYKHATEDEIMIFKSKKNQSLLQAAELKYGIDSPHYKHLRETVESDEKKSELINDFR